VLIFAPTAATLMHVAGFLERWMRNVRSDQSAWGGTVPEIVPLPPAVAAASDPPVRASAGWSDVITAAPRVLYDHYGDDRFLSDNFDAMRAWVDVQTRQARDLLPPRLRDVTITSDQRERQMLLWNGVPNFGDWLAPSTMSDHDQDPLEALGRAARLTGEHTGPAFQAMSLDNLAFTAESIGRHEVAERARQHVRRVRHAYAFEYIGDDGRIEPDMQGVYVLALAARLVPDHHRPAVAQQLVRLIRDNGNHLDTGFASVGYLLDVLWDTGHADLARTLLLQDTMPSWLYEVSKGATTIWESWDAIREDGTVNATSLNHYAYGCVVDWMMRRLAGIVLTAPGYRTVRIEPDLDGPLDACSAHIDTPYGRLAVDWQRSGARAEVVVSVPVGVMGSFSAAAGWSHDGGSGPFGSGRHRIHVHRQP
jgi:alpha-L-rhamnosidase